MSHAQLSQQVDAYTRWKRELLREITRYRSWLTNCRLGNELIDARLDRAQKILRSDQLTLAFVGEFSRGKSELINALLFADYGQRMLPSQAGRTTMCPTELFFDSHAAQPYIRLLPIETRLSGASIAQFKRSPKHWQEQPLDAQDPQAMSQALQQIAQCKEVPIEQAISLGFLPETLEPAATPGLVLIPAWRHVLVNFDHPLLRQGLRVLDTPGLNALGSEPELTLSMLPSAQAIIFLLGADTGVTASDMAIWQQHLSQIDSELKGSRFAVLNKIDTLWDDLAGEQASALAIAKVRQQTARHLGIELEDVLPLSAKQALFAKANHDPVLLAQSRIESLEELLCQRIVQQKEDLISQGLVHELLGLINNSQHALNTRLAQVREQQGLLSNHRQDNGQLLFDLANQTKREHAQHHKRLLGLKTNQRLLKRQGELLNQAARPERLEEHLSRVRSELASSWTTLGIHRAINNFFRATQTDLENLNHEALLANKMVASIYQRHNAENPLQGVDAPQLKVPRYLRELGLLHEKAERFQRDLKNLLTEQRILSQRFFATLAKEVINLHHRLRQDIAQWSQDALLPLLQNSLEHKQLLESHMLRLKMLAQQTQQSHQRVVQLTHYQSELEQQLQEAAEILRILRRPPPAQRQAKVVSLPGIARS